MAKSKVSKEVEALLKKHKQGIKLDIGCGEHKQPGFVGMDIQQLPGVDFVWDFEKFPWPFPDESVSFALASHVVEHISPDRADARTTGLIKLLLKKKRITQAEVDEFIGNPDPGSIFIAFMDEVWRVMQTGCTFMISLPYANSFGYWQDPTHVNGCNEATFAYFDPGHKSDLWPLYRPKPWRIVNCAFNVEGFMEIALVKRKIDKEGHIYD